MFHIFWYSWTPGSSIYRIGKGGVLFGPSVPLFTLDYLSKHSHRHTSLILLIAQNLLLLAFCFLLVPRIDPTQMRPSSISPSGLFQGITCNIERLKEGPWSPELLGDRYRKGDLIWKGNLRPLFIPFKCINIITLRFWKKEAVQYFLNTFYTKTKLP